MTKARAEHDSGPAKLTPGQQALAEQFYPFICGTARRCSYGPDDHDDLLSFLHLALAQVCAKWDEHRPNVSRTSFVMRGVNWRLWKYCARRKRRWEAESLGLEPDLLLQEAMAPDHSVKWGDALKGLTNLERRVLQHLEMGGDFAGVARVVGRRDWPQVWASLEAKLNAYNWVGH